MSEEDRRRRVVYLKKPKGAPSAPIRTMKGHKPKKSRVGFQETTHHCHPLV
jgi:hypothetical protein